MLHLYALFEEYIHILCNTAVSIRLGVHPVCMGGTGFPAGRTMVDSCRLGGVSYPPPTHKFLQRLLYWMQVKTCVVSPLRRGQRKFKKQRRCHYNEKTAHQFSAGAEHDAEPCARGGVCGRSSEPRISAEAIDSQKAARWCVEQSLMQADGTSFKPSRHTFRLQVIKAWNDLQAMQKAG